MNAAEPAEGLARAEAVLAESGELMRLAAERSLTVRLTGSLAIRAVCPGHAPLLAALGRRWGYAPWPTWSSSGVMPPALIGTMSIGQLDRTTRQSMCAWKAM